MRNVVLLGTLLALAGCQTHEQFGKNMDSWTGAPEEELVSFMGPPKNWYEAGGTKFLEYSESQTGYVPPIAPSLYRSTISGGMITTTPIGGSPGYAYQRSCRVVFTVRGGIVQGWRSEGNNCVA